MSRYFLRLPISCRSSIGYKVKISMLPFGTRLLFFLIGKSFFFGSYLLITCFSVGNVSLFEVCLERAADMIISTFLSSQKKTSSQCKNDSYSYTTQNDLYNPQQEHETLQCEDLNMCTTLAGHYIHSLFVHFGWINDKRYKSHCRDHKVTLKKAEELLKKTIILCQLYHNSKTKHLKLLFKFKITQKT
jgi:hypothetical protein